MSLYLFVIRVLSNLARDTETGKFSSGIHTWGYMISKPGCFKIAMFLLLITRGNFFFFFDFGFSFTAEEF